MNRFFAFSTTSRVLLLLVGLTSWAVVLATTLSPQAAQAFTPFINNVRRAANACYVRGLFVNRKEGEVAFMGLNASLMCGKAAR
jgi:hypothetical protein